MKKAYHSHIYCYYCKYIRSKYQAKRKTRKRKRKSKKIQHDYDVKYETLELKPSDLNKIINDISRLESKSNFKINFRDLNKFDLGLCLIFTSLLDSLKEQRNISYFSYKKTLMPKNKKIKDLFIQTGILSILCNKSIDISKNCGKIRILKEYIDTQEKLKNVLLKISQDLIIYSLKQIQNRGDITNARILLNKIFGELLLNAKSHANATNKIVYLAGEVDNGVLKFAILDGGIGFVGSVKARSTLIDKSKEFFANYVDNDI